MTLVMFLYCRSWSDVSNLSRVLLVDQLAGVLLRPDLNPYKTYTASITYRRTLLQPIDGEIVHLVLYKNRHLHTFTTLASTC